MHILSALMLVLVSQTDDPYLVRATQAHEAGKFADVVDLMTEAYRYAPKPRYLYEMSQAYQAMGNWVEAESKLELTLNASDDQWVRKYQSVLQGILVNVRKRLGTIDVETDPPTGVEIVLNGVSVGRTPVAALRAVVGTAVVEVKAEGFITLTRPIEVKSQGRSREFFKLVRESPRPEAAAGSFAPVVPEPAVASVSRARNGLATSPPSAKPSSRLPVALWALSGVAGASLAVGATLGILSNNDAARSNEIGCPARPTTDAECVGIQDDIATKRTIAGISLGAGGAAALGVVLILILGIGDENNTTWVAPMADRTGLVVGQRF